MLKSTFSWLSKWISLISNLDGCYFTVISLKLFSKQKLKFENNIQKFYLLEATATKTRLLVTGKSTLFIFYYFPRTPWVFTVNLNETVTQDAAPGCLLRGNRKRHANQHSSILRGRGLPSKRTNLQPNGCPWNVHGAKSWTIMNHLLTRNPAYPGTHSC